jgi:hypothetical protein
MRAGAEFNWSSGYFAEYPWNFFNQPTIATVVGGFLPEDAKSPIDTIIQKLPDEFSKSPNFWKIMGLLNAKYIMIQGDSVYPSEISYITAPPEHFSEVLAHGYIVPDFDRAYRISDCETTEFWNMYGWCEENITVDNSKCMEGSSSLKISSIIPEVKEGGVQFNSEGSWDVSSYEYLSFWIEFEDKSMKSIHEVICEIWDSNENHRRWIVTDQVYGNWSRVDIPLNKNYFWQGPAPPDLSSIDSISISLLSSHEKQTSANWWIDNVELIPLKNVPMEHVYHVKTFGKLAFYQVDEEYFVPCIYATNQFFITLNVLSMFDTYTGTSVDPRDKIAFLDSQSSMNNMTLLTSLETKELYKPDITFQQINPCKYKVSVHNATQPFFLVLSSTYHKEWKAYIDGEQLSDEYHFIANQYANAWYINKNGTYNAIIEFFPQRLSEYGSLISVMTSIVCIACLALKYRKKLCTRIRNWKLIIRVRLP